MSKQEHKTFSTTVRMDIRQVVDAVKFLEHFGARLKTMSDIYRESLKTLQQLGINNEILTPCESTEEAILFLQERQLMPNPDKSTQEAINKAIALESLSLKEVPPGSSIYQKPEEDKVTISGPVHGPNLSPERIKRIQEQFQREQETQMKETSLRRHSESGDDHYVDDSFEASQQRAQEADERTQEEKSALATPPKAVEGE